jgi:flagellar secretion chaperone FliS
MTSPAENKLGRYGAVKVTTCTPGQLLLMVYDALLRFLREAMVAMETKDRSRVSERTNRCHQLFEQLFLALDPSVSPTLCDKLGPLYIFCMRRVLEANVHQDATRLIEIIGILTPLREAWGIAVEQAAREAASPAAAPAG